MTIQRETDEDNRIWIVECSSPLFIRVKSYRYLIWV